MKYKLLLDEQSYLTGFVHTDSPEDTFELDATSLELDHIDCYKLVDGVLEFDADKCDAKVQAQLDLEAAEARKAANLDKLANMLTTERVPSDKLGFDWLVYRLGELEVMKEYVPAESQKGTLTNPIPFELGIDLIPNAYYSFDDHLWVYMGRPMVAVETPTEDVDAWAFWE